MKVLYLLFSFTTGGTERLVTDICNEMIKRDHQVHLYVVNDLYDQSMLDALCPDVQVFLQKRPAGSNDKLHTLLSVARYIRTHNIQVVHCHSMNAPELLLLKPIAFPRVKVLYTVHSMNSYSQLSARKIAFRNRLCHRLIAISQSVQKEMLRCGAAPDKLITIYNAIDLERFPLQAPKAFQKDTITIGNIARINPQIKGQDILIDALKHLQKDYPALQCYFAGAPDSDHTEELQILQQKVSDLGLENRVHFLGNVTDIPSFLQTLDLFVLPSRSEGFGISLVEALATGIPCIASDLDGPAEVLKQGQYGLLFRAEDASDLAQKLLHVLDNYTMYRSAAIAQAAEIRERYQIAGMCDQMESIIN